MSTAPAFQFYVGDWLSSPAVMAMDWDAKGVLVHLMAIAWRQDPAGTVPDDDAQLRRWCVGIGSRDWNRIRPQVFSAWVLEGGRWVLHWMVEQADRQAQYRATQAANGSRGGRPRKPMTFTTKTDGLANGSDSQNPAESGREATEKLFILQTTSAADQSAVVETPRVRGNPSLTDGNSEEAYERLKERATEFAGWLFEQAMELTLYGRQIRREPVVQADLEAAILLLRHNGDEEAHARGLRMLRAQLDGTLTRRDPSVRALLRCWDWACVAPPPAVAGAVSAAGVYGMDESDRAALRGAGAR